MGRQATLARSIDARIRKRVILDNIARLY